MAHPLAYEAFAGQSSKDNASTPHVGATNAFTRTMTETDPSCLPTGTDSFSKNNDWMRRQTSFGFPNGFIKHYQIIRELGQGGMGSVFLSRDRRLERLVAIKILHHDGRARARLLAEARATARAKHENIVNIYDIGMFQTRPYMVLEYLSGQTLRSVLTASNEIGLSRGLALEIMISVIQALGAAHGNGVIHRDLKPENVMILDSGKTKVLDFGIARRIEKNERKKPIGTFAYMSPEHWLGQDVDPRSDIWGAGMLLFEVLSGVHPLAPLATRDLSLIADLERPMPSLRELRADLGGLCDIVDRCLRKRKEERFQSTDELLAAISRFRS